MQEIGEAAEKGELNGLVWNSPDLARRDVSWSFVVSLLCGIFASNAMLL